MSSIFISNATLCTGPAIIRTLVAHRYHVICHDPSFTNKGAREDFARETKTYAIGAQSPEDICKEVSSIGDVDRFVFHQPNLNARALNEDVCLDTLNDDFMAFPFRLNALFLPELKSLKRGAIVFITSAQQLKHISGDTVPTGVQANSMALIAALAVETEPFGIQVNALHTILKDGELSLAKDVLVGEAADITDVENTVPAERTITPVKFGELVESFVSRKSPFKTGQEIQFTES